MKIYKKVEYKYVCYHNVDNIFHMTLQRSIPDSGTDQV